MKDHEFGKRYGPWAVVTGASTGIGEAIATELAKRGLNLVLVARREGLLATVGKRINAKHGIVTRMIVADLTTREGISEVQKQTGDIDVGLLVNNAGREDSGRFIESDPNDAILTLDLNVRAPLLLSHHFAGRLAQRRRGGLIFLSSIVAFQGVPTIANYAATKAYVLVLAESLAAELEPKGIDILAAAPGFTATGLSPDFDFSGTPIKPMTAESVARSIVYMLGRRRLIIPGATNKLLYHSGKHLLPRRLNTSNFGRVFKTVLRHKLTARVPTEPTSRSAQCVPRERARAD